MTIRSGAARFSPPGGFSFPIPFPVLFPVLGSLFILFLGGACAAAPPPPAAGGVPMVRKGKMSTAVLALVERQNYIFDGEHTHIHPDGLAFYFVMYPSSPSGAVPSIKRYQNFTVNGESYWQNTPGSYDSFTVVYNQKTFEELEPQISAKIAIKQNTKVFIQKTVICGLPLPSQGTVLYPLFFGFGQSLEEFDFQFNLKDVL
ncbi:MAG: hypothetical protein LBG84_01475 [Treponema sp.]|jgi:hypothetical protein|nr:hypothetical protein [Treponema sp.]